MIKNKITASALALAIAFTSVASFSSSVALAAPNNAVDVHESKNTRLFGSGFWDFWGSKKATITEISPEEGEVGAEVTLVGKKFTEDSVVRFGQGVISDIAVSDDGKVLTFIVPTEMAKYCPPYKVCTLQMLGVSEDDYKVQVQNGYRLSNAVWFEVTDNGTTTPDDEVLSIENIDGPTSLMIDEEGTWNLDVESENGGMLNYSVKWGDEGGLMSLSGVSTKVQSSSSFAHSYSEAGTYEPEFTVTDEEGATVTKIASKVVVDEDVEIGVPVVTSITPEKTTAGASVTLVGTGFGASSTVTLGETKVTDITIESESKITFTIPALAVGTYKVSVSNNNGVSNMIDLAIEKKVKSRVSINGISAPSVIEVGEMGTWTVNAASNLRGNLQYSVDWGEGVTARGLTSSSMTQSSATFTHAYETEGTYKPKFTVTDEQGTTAHVSASVIVEAVDGE